MNMIPAQPGYSAFFEVEDGSGNCYDLPVHAWDEDGFPMVLDGRSLVSAKRAGKYVCVEEDPNPPVIAVAPAAGWWVEYADGFKEPVIAWGVHGDGSVRPLTTDSDGQVDETRCAEGKCRVFYQEGGTS